MIRKTTKQFIKDADDLHCSKYNYSKTKYISAHKKVIIICITHGEFEQTPRNHLFGRNGKGQGCPKCAAISKFDNLKLTNYKIDFDLLNNNNKIKRIGNYKGISINIEWECLQCNNLWLASPNQIRCGGGCPKCKDTRLTNEDIDTFILQHSLQLKRVDNYINAYTKINWQCFKCNNVWLAKPSEITRLGKRSIGSGCPECARGINEKIVGKVLEQLNIKIKKLRIDLPTVQKLFPDFYLPELNTIIEYNGIQHYSPTCFGSMSKLQAEISFQKQKIRDNLLREYCQERNISLLEIDGRKYKGENLKKFVMSHFKNSNEAINE